jgi:hypothetical protein
MQIQSPHRLLTFRQASSRPSTLPSDSLTCPTNSVRLRLTSFGHKVARLAEADPNALVVLESLVDAMLDEG